MSHISKRNLGSFLHFRGAVFIYFDKQFKGTRYFPTTEVQGHVTEAGARLIPSTTIQGTRTITDFHIKFSLNTAITDVGTGNPNLSGVAGVNLVCLIYVMKPGTDIDQFKTVDTSGTSFTHSWHNEITFRPVNDVIGQVVIPFTDLVNSESELNIKKDIVLYDGDDLRLIVFNDPFWYGFVPSNVGLVNNTAQCFANLSFTLDYKIRFN